MQARKPTAKRNKRGRVEKAGRIEEIARESLGFSSLRPGQKEAIEAIPGGHDALVVQPTGSGKSAIYQIAGLLIDGASVIVSPLIALQKDQADSIEDRKTAEVAVVNSLQRISEIRDRLARLEGGSIEFIFLAPEQLHKPETIERLRRSRVSLFVIDEAHCINEWGHDFRPDYLSPAMRKEIIHRLGMRRPKIVVRDFDRPNIYLRVDRFETEPEKREVLIHRVHWAAKPGIVYTGTRKAAEEIMEGLAAEGIEVVFYHGGLRRKQRDEVQE